MKNERCLLKIKIGKCKGLQGCKDRQNFLKIMLRLVVRSKGGFFKRVCVLKKEVALKGRMD